MKEETAPTKLSAASQKPGDQQADDVAARQRNMFVGAVLNMSWQLAVVVLVPVLGGHVLDDRLHSAPLLTVIGLVVAIATGGLIVWRQSRLLSPDVMGANKHQDEGRR